jgi:hypothetical protein
MNVLGYSKMLVRTKCGEWCWQMDDEKIKKATRRRITFCLFVDHTQ